jgi:hypothetical protein
LAEDLERKVATGLENEQEELTKSNRFTTKVVQDKSSSIDSTAAQSAHAAHPGALQLLWGKW